MSVGGGLEVEEWLAVAFGMVEDLRKERGEGEESEAEEAAGRGIRWPFYNFVLLDVLELAWGGTLCQIFNANFIVQRLLILTVAQSDLIFCTKSQIPAS